jgi:hypothetical protein
MNREDDAASEEEEFDWYLHRALIQMARAIERKYRNRGIRYQIELIGVPRGREGAAPLKKDGPDGPP